MENGKNNGWLKGPVLNLVLSPVVALLLTHFYELGFAIYFGIHPKFITISLSTAYFLFFAIVFAIFAIIGIYLLIRLIKFKIFKYNEDNISYKKRENHLVSILQLFILVIIFTFGAYIWGYSKAMDQKLYLIRETTPEQVVLRIYGDKLITAPYDKQNKEVRYGHYYITQIGDEPHILIKYDVVGPLSSVKY